MTRVSACVCRQTARVAWVAKNDGRKMRATARLLGMYRYVRVEASV